MLAVTEFGEEFVGTGAVRCTSTRNHYADCFVEPLSNLLDAQEEQLTGGQLRDIAVRVWYERFG